MITYHHATKEHIPEIIMLQKANLLCKMPEEKQGDGFVTTAITPTQFEELIAQEGLFIAAKQGKVVAYVVSASWQYLSQWPIFAYMVTLFDSFTYDQTVMTTQNSYQYGPICIDENERGQGIAKGIFDYACNAMSKHYPYGLTFINKRNPRSYKAHVEKIGIEVICDFTFNDQAYHCLGFKTMTPPRIKPPAA